MNLQSITDFFRALNPAQWIALIGSIAVAIATPWMAVIQQRDAKQSAEESGKKLLALQERHFDFAQKAEEARQKDVIVANAPDLRIDSAQVIDRAFQVVVKNYGRGTAENVEVAWNYAYAATHIQRHPELPSNRILASRSAIFPDEEIPAMRAAYADIKGYLAKGEKALVVFLNLQYSWHDRVEKRKYYLMWDGTQLKLSALTP